MSRRTFRVLLAATAAAVPMLLGAAGPAAAHGSNGQPIPDAAHYLTQVTGVSPAVHGITVRVDPRGEWISVTNDTSQKLMVYGYFREPYLEVTKDGVWSNSLSSTLQLNQSLFADLSSTSSANLPPSWTRTSAGRTAKWHDHRIHWMSAIRPPKVQAHPGTRQLIGTWHVSMQLAETPITVTGTLSWLPVKPGGMTVKQTLLFGLDAAALLIGVLGVWLYLLRRRGSATKNEAPVNERVPLP